MIYQTGTINNSIKLACLELEWEQKKADGFKAMKKQENLTAEERMIIQYQEDFAKMQENSKMQKISSKISAGMELTDEEIIYLQRKNPQLLNSYNEVKAEKEAYERKIKSCRSKEDVDKLKMYKLGEFASEIKKIANNPNIPKSEKIRLLGKILGEANVVQEVHNDFVESGQYASLPDDNKPDNEKDYASEETTVSEEQSSDEQTENETEAVLKEATEYIKSNRSPGEGLDILLNANKTLPDEMNKE